MLLKGGEETGKAANPRAAAGDGADPARLLRADLPAPDELIRMLGGEGSLARSGKPAPAETSASRNAPLNAAPESQPSSQMSAVASAAPIPFDSNAYYTDDDGLGFDADYEASLDDLAGDGTGSALADPRSFDDVIAIASGAARHDAESASGGSCQPGEVRRGRRVYRYVPAPGCAAAHANELREKLNRWTGRKWVVVLSKAKGERTRGEVRRERASAEMEALRSHPAVKAVLDQFPDAKIADIRR